MEKIIIEANNELFSVEFERDDNWYEGNVYPVDKYSNGLETIYSYESNTEGGLTHEELNDDCRVMFRFLFCYRGVWEGRIYFPDDEEYWSEELKTISEVWDKIEVILKDMIKTENPSFIFDE